MDKVICLYVPVIHQGYLELFNRHRSGVAALYVFSNALVEELKYRGHEKRAMNSENARTMIEVLRIFPQVGILTRYVIGSIQDSRIVLAKDGMSTRLAEKYLSGCDIEWDTTFLRWDETNVFSQQPLDSVRVSDDLFDRTMIQLAIDNSQQSSDWWRHVGAVVVKDRTVISTGHNQHLPSEFTPYINGDPRDPIEPGKHSELCSALHSEQVIVSLAARKVLEGTDVYVTVFPCPVCAKLFAMAGIRRCFFRSGHASLDGQDIFRTFNVEMIRVS